MQTSVNQLLDERGKTHGQFWFHAEVTIALKQIILAAMAERTRQKLPPLTATQLESIHMICHKLGRIMAGDASFSDHWEDIAGYATLINSLQGKRPSKKDE